MSHAYVVASVSVESTELLRHRRSCSPMRSPNASEKEGCVGGCVAFYSDDANRHCGHRSKNVIGDADKWDSECWLHATLTCCYNTALQLSAINSPHLIPALPDLIIWKLNLPKTAFILFDTPNELRNWRKG